MCEPVDPASNSPNMSCLCSHQSLCTVPNQAKNNVLTFRIRLILSTSSPSPWRCGPSIFPHAHSHTRNCTGEVTSAPKAAKSPGTYL